MATGVDEEVAKYRDMLKNNGTMPSVESGLSPVRNPVEKPGKKKHQSAGRFAEMNAFIDLTMAELTRAEIATWMTLFRFTDVKKNTATISIEKISTRSGTSVRHIHKAIGSLLAKGLIERLKTGSLNTGASVYRLHPTMNP